MRKEQHEMPATRRKCTKGANECRKVATWKQYNTKKGVTWKECNMKPVQQGKSAT